MLVRIEGEGTLAAKWLGEEDFSREYVVRWSLNPDSTMTFFLVPGRPNLMRNVRELISGKLVNEERNGTIDVLKSIGDNTLEL